MSNNRVWMVAAALGAGAIFWGVGQAVGPSSADTEFQKTVESIKQVKSFRGAYVLSESSSLHSERVWEVDCNRVIVHQQSQDSSTNTDSPFETKEEELSVGDQSYIRDSSGSWETIVSATQRRTAKFYCESIARGGAPDLLPDMSTMLSHGITEKGDKKVVNGARCREWKFDIRTALSSRKGSVCIGVDDHLPYELVLDGGRYSYSDYNRPIQIDAPEALLQPASSTGGSN